jgi:hypothetical protein
VLTAAIDAELVAVNPGPTIHSIKLTAAGIEAGRAVQRDGKRNAEGVIDHD